MKMICAPSQVMREGRDLNQHGQAGRQEQASSSSPVTFHEVLLAASAALPGMPNATMPHAIPIETTDLLNMTSFISLFVSLNHCHFSGECIPMKGLVNIESQRDAVKRLSSSRRVQIRCGVSENQICLRQRCVLRRSPGWTSRLKSLTTIHSRSFMQHHSTHWS